MAKDTDFSRFEGDAMLDLLNGNEEAFKEKLGNFDPEIISGLFARSKDLGRDAYKQGDYAQAIEYYTGALALAPTSSEKAKLFANRSQCYMQLSRYEDGLEEAHKAIASDQKWSKAWFRAGRCLAQLCHWESAQAALRQSLKLVERDNAEFREVTRLIENVTESLEKERKKRRYATDYSRFQKLAEKLVAEESLEEYRKKLEEESHPDIEFAADLTPDQRRSLELQLTGKVGESEPKITVLSRKHFDLSLEKVSNRQSVHEDAVRGLLTLQSEGRMADRVISLVGSPILTSYEECLSRHMAEDLKTFLFCGCETYQLVLHAYKLRKLSKDAVIHLLNLNVVPVALDLLLRQIVRNSISEAGDVHIFAKTDLAEGNKLPTSSPRTSPSTLGDDEEAELVNQGAAAISDRVVRLPMAPDCLVIDPSHIEGCLFGPKNPFKLIRQLSPLRLLPNKLTLKMALAKIDHAMSDSVTWSLLPDRMPRRLKNHVSLLTSFVEVWTVTIENFRELPPPELTIPMSVEKITAVNCLVFALEVTIGENASIDTWQTFTETNAPLGQLTPHFFWLRTRDGDEGTSQRASQVSLRFNGSLLYAAVVTDEAGVVRCRSDQQVEGTSDKFKWDASFGFEADRAFWSSCLTAFRNIVVSRLEARAKQRGFLDDADAPPLRSDIQTRIGIVELEGVAPLILMLQRLLRKKPAVHKGLGPNVDVGLDLFAVAETAAYSYRKNLRQPIFLRSIRNACWETGTDMKIEWHGCCTANQRELDTWESDTRTWLFARDESGSARVEVKAGDLHLVRCPTEKETPETRTALCQFFDVPLDTPGVDDTTSCTRLTSLWEGMIYGLPSNLPPNGISSGIVASIIYAKQTLLTPSASICPGRLRVLGRLCRFNEAASELLPIMNCGRTVNLSSSLPLGKKFQYGEFRAVDALELAALGTELHPTTIELFDLDFNGDVENIMKSFNRHRVYKLKQVDAFRVSAILIWCEWTMAGSSVLCNAPPDCCSCVEGKSSAHHPSAMAQQAVQILPPLKPSADLTEIGLQLIPMRGYKDFIVTWENARENDVDDSRIMTSEVYGALSARNSETAFGLSNQLMKAPELTQSLVTAVIGFVRHNELANEGEIDLATVNNFLSFLAA